MDFWTQKRVLVSGVSGFLGSWLAGTLVDRGAAVVGLVRDLSPPSDAADKDTRSQYTAALGRLEDYEALLRIVNEYEIDTVFHLGAQAIVGTANRSPLSTRRMVRSRACPTRKTCRCRDAIRTTFRRVARI
jgi:CDP-glucose 4,6-dehydratase